MSDSEAPTGDPYETEEEIIPCDRAAFWARLCELIEERFPCDHSEGQPRDSIDDRCIEWLVANVKEKELYIKQQDPKRPRRPGVDRKTVERWCGKPGVDPCRPRWKKVILIVDALNRGSGSPKILVPADLVRGLPKHRSGARDTAAGPTPGAPTASVGAAPAAGGAAHSSDPPGEASGVKDLAALRVKVEEDLKRAPALAAALASRGYGSLGSSAQDVTSALLKAAAKNVAADLARLAGTLEHRDVARRVLWHILPLAGDWNDLLEQAGADASAPVLELKLRTETVAEIVLARIEARCCLFAPGDLTPQGAAHVPLPASEKASFFDLQCTGLVEGVLNNLWAEQQIGRPRVPGEELWKGIRKIYRKDSEYLIAAAGEINEMTVHGARRYLLVIDAILGPDLVPDLEAWWAAAQTVLRAELPGLRLVRLKGGDAEMKTEYGVVPHVRVARDVT